MAQRAVSLDEDMFCCSICLDLLTEPVTIPCGHNYCLTCISNHWTAQEQRGGYSCPQCREVFLPRPVLGKNTMLADLVEEMKKMEVQDAPPPHLYVGPGDMGCDFCCGRKLKATKSCLQCLASYCDLHLQPHYDSPAFQSHKLVPASADIQENICSLHNKMKEIFCRSDQQTICYLCSLEDHRGHHTVSAAAERADRQQELGSTQQDIQQRVRHRDTDLKLLQKTLEDVDSSADDAVQDVQQMFHQLLQLLDRSSSDMQQQIRSQQEEEVSRLKELQQKVQQEISELTRRDAELEKLSHTEDHSQFLRRFLSLTSLSPSPNIHIQPVNYFKEVAAAVTQLTQKLQDTLTQECTRISRTRADPSPTPAQPETPQSPQALLSRLGSKESAPAGPLEPEESKASASPPTPAESGPVPTPPPRLQSSEPRFLQPSACATFTSSSIEPSAPVYTPSVQVKTPKPLYPLPTERTIYPFTPPLGYPSAPAGTVPSAPVYTSTGSRTSQPAAPPAPDPPTVSPLRRLLQNYSNISSPAHPAPEQSRGPLPGLTKNPFTPPLGYPSPNPFKGSPPAAPTPAEPRTRAEFLSYACRVTFDPNTANKLLVLSGQNRRATRAKRKQSYPNHPERFRDRFQVLSREVLTGRCYWEVEWHGIVSVAVAYRRMVRAGGTSGFGDNKMSWALYCHNNKYIHDGTGTVLSGPQSSRIGVYLDYQAGVLSFYSVSATMVLLHRVQTSFTEPLHAGICVGSGSAELLQLL
ncbi:E3 ubiquitin/ISG15 ligase TRIM25 isoform X1 [Fundulus heteroclitus]|uniref:E3 ubiquitin/ISG15 ligase TRIM25 isoform X1 n=1 Tax=Fundulus heteroclitus TaxID=8078 RepID=UPI00165C8FF3|nr:E3 ubiquitin/ISG15 ligase TRIM25 isoform X1 [Fundulus heteroclitus]